MTLSSAFNREETTASDSVLMSVILVIALCTCTLSDAMSTLRRLLLSGDIETNPGPNGSPSDNPKEKGQKETDSSTTQRDAIAPDAATQILQAIRDQSDQISLLGNEIKAIRTELKDVTSKCNEINERCDRLEKDKKELALAVSNIVVDIGRLHEDTKKNREVTDNLSETSDNLREEIVKMNDEIDRLESFSRRDNLRVFGIPQNSPNENYNVCASAVIQALNNGANNRSWSEEDIIRAHRIGQGDPKPMIVKFRNWKDKMELLTNRDLRATLEKNGIRVANDLTKRQAAVVAQARKEGKSAYFVRGVLTTGPRKTPPRSYAEAASADAGMERKEDTRSDRGTDQCQHSGRGSGDSPRYVTSSGSPRMSGEGTRQASASARGGGSGGVGRGGSARADRGDNRGRPQQAGMKSYLSTTSKPNTPGSDSRVLRSTSSSK